MKVLVRTTMGLKKTIGQDRIQIVLENGETVANLMDRLVSRWGKVLADQIFLPGARNPRSGTMIMVNGRNIHFLNQLDTVLQEGDEVTILPAVGGG